MPAPDFAQQLQQDLDDIEHGVAAAAPGSDSRLIALSSRLAAVAGLHRGLLEDALAELDMTQVEEQVIGILRGGVADTPGELARLMWQTRAGMTRTLDRLERRGLVRRDADPEDGRRVRIRLTAKGDRTAERRHELEAEALESAFGDAEKAELERLRRALDRVIERLAAARSAHANWTP
ncbi:MAG: MarR family winged helix-turn-helix transcriptional regulator [Myxococcota bacterium]